MAERFTSDFLGCETVGFSAQPPFTLARNQGRSPPGQRLPAPTGWRFGDVGASHPLWMNIAGINQEARR